GGSGRKEIVQFIAEDGGPGEKSVERSIGMNGLRAGWPPARAEFQGGHGLLGFHKSFFGDLPSDSSRGEIAPLAPFAIAGRAVCTEGRSDQIFIVRAIIHSTEVREQDRIRIAGGGDAGSLCGS